MTRFTGLAVACCLAAMPVRAQALQDLYGPLVEWRQASGLEVAPIHIGLLPNGKLFFVNEYNYFQHPEVNLAKPGIEPEFMFLMPTTAPFAAQPATFMVTPIKNAAPFKPVLNTRTNLFRMKSLVCSGHALLANGNLFFASGAEGIVDLAIYRTGNLYDAVTVDGIAESVTYNTTLNTWTVNPKAIVKGPQGEPLRWYATVTRLADSRMLVTGGYEAVIPQKVFNNSVEVFDPARNSWASVSGLALTPPGIENPDYTHVWQWPYADPTKSVMMVGGSGEPLFMLMKNGVTTWQHTNNFRPGAKEFIDAFAPEPVFPNYGSSSTLLPLRLPEDSWGYANGSILYAGGEHDTPGNGNVDVYDPVANAWRPSIPMHGGRHHPSTVILPDGRILILAGHDDDSPASRTGYAEYVDPRNDFAITEGTSYMPEIRGYHTVTVLLPDGRVVVGSGNPDGNDAIERSDFRYYYPDYMFKARPTVTSAPAALKFGGTGQVMVPRGTVVSEVALVALGSQTHSFDMNQRHVQLRITGPTSPACRTPTTCYDAYTVRAPTSKELAPPGHYILFVLGQDRAPSLGRIIVLQ